MSTQAETKTCKITGKEFELYPDELAFYEKMDIPIPDMCPEERQRHRAMFRNFKTLYKRTSDKGGESLISMYHGDVPFPVWSHEEWWSDDWDAKSYGREVDFSRPLFDQIKELWNEVPRYAVLNTQSTNCVYANFSFESKNCYLVFGCVKSEECNYGHIVWGSQNCFDCSYVFKSEFCFECTDVLNSYRCIYSEECDACADSIGLYDCRGCTNCIGCVNLRQKSHCIFNEQKTKEEYEKFLDENPLNDPKTIEYIIAERERMRLDAPHPYYYGSHNQDVTGNHVYHAKNMHNCFDVKGGENSCNAYTLRNAVDCFDCSFSPDIELGYQVVAGVGRMLFCCHNVVNSSDCYYSQDCFACSNIFACQGLRNAEYCILNKQYSKQEYLDIVEKIKNHMKQTGEWGQFFTKDMTPFAYNESIAHEYTPLSKEQAYERGLEWKEDIPNTFGKETINYDQLPKNPAEYSDDLTKEVLKCEKTGRNFRLIQPEIAFYKQMNLPLPKYCFDVRHEIRMEQRLPRKLWKRTTADGVEVMTPYSPDRPEKIYSEKGYQDLIL